MKQSTLGSSSTILHPLTEVRGRKFCSALTVNKLNLLTVRATFLQIKLWENKLEGQIHPDIKIQVSFDKKQSTLGSSSTILHPLTEVRGRKFALTSTS